MQRKWQFIWGFFFAPLLWFGQFLFSFSFTDHFCHSITGYSDELGASFVELPYNEKDKSVSMFVFLPSETSNIGAVVESLTANVFDEVERHAYEAKVTIGLPQMSFSQRYQLADVS